jgi:dTMP kinase
VIIAFEGIDGAGKSTAALDLSARLTEKGIDNVLIGSASLRDNDAERAAVSTKFASRSEEDEEVIREIWELRDEIAQGFGPRALCLSNAWEFAYRWESLAVPALEVGKIVIADRYVDTALVREVLRGVDENYVRSVYSFVPDPDLVVYVQLDPGIAYERKTRAGLIIGYFEAGRDVIRGTRSVRMSFVAFQSKCRERYEQILARDNVLRVDGARKPAHVHTEIARAVLARIKRSTQARVRRS